MSQTNEISFNLNGGFYPEESVLQAASMFQEVVEVVVNKIGKEYADQKQERDSKYGPT